MKDCSCRAAEIVCRPAKPIGECSFHSIRHLPLGNGNMIALKETVQIDQAGRLVLPKRLRDRFQLKSGDTLAVRVKGDAIELRPTKPAFRLERINGVLVLAGDMPLPSRDLVAEAREE
jgi:AbrB family looped-hinge helix DNA binding protein